MMANIVFLGGGLFIAGWFSVYTVYISMGVEFVCLFEPEIESVEKEHFPKPKVLIDNFYNLDCKEGQIFLLPPQKIAKSIHASLNVFFPAAAIPFWPM